MDLMIPIDRSHRTPLVDQLYAGVRTAIADGTLEPGARLPSTRELARQLGLTRFTVDDAYSRLVSEGYLEARHGSGTYVAERVRLPQASAVPHASVARSPLQLSAWAARLPANPGSDTPPPGIEFNFLGGEPAYDLLPLTTWHRLIAREARRQDLMHYAYGDTAGLCELREAIATWIGRSRGVACGPEQVIVTSGAQQSMDLVMRLTLDPGTSAVVEDPCYRWVRRLAGMTGATVHTVPVDAEGLRVDLLPGPETTPRLVCVTPSHQYPTGGVLPLARRLDLLAWAQAMPALVLEDDYDGELRYDSRPLPALAALANAPGGPGNVIYMGSFSKVLYPALRLGYLVVPPSLVDVFTAAKATVARHAPTLTQAVVAAFIREGHFERHLVRMRRAYAARHDAMVEAIGTHLSGVAQRDYATTSAGLHLMVRIDRNVAEADLVARAQAAGIAVEGASPCFVVPPDQPHLFLGYAMMAEEPIRQGIARLAGVIRAM
jgi:GntR family transcriptional regulator/MocR family aminotransferase